MVRQTRAYPAAVLFLLALALAAANLLWTARFHQLRRGLGCG